MNLVVIALRFHYPAVCQYWILIPLWLYIPHISFFSLFFKHRQNSNFFYKIMSIELMFGFATREHVMLGINGLMPTWLSKTPFINTSRPSTYWQQQRHPVSDRAVIATEIYQWRFIGIPFKVFSPWRCAVLWRLAIVFAR